MGAPEHWIAAAIAFVLTTVLSLALGAVLLLRMRADYFVVDRVERYRAQGPLAPRIALLVGKNLLGAALVVLGVLLSLPGIPGQGLLTVLVGLLLLDVPGKRRLERAILRRKTVRRAVDRLRARYGREPLILGDEDQPVAAGDTPT